ncbi:hypothetical protein ACFSO7_20425 [Bacillus sp. CGMCC 1.16607]|uniref:hypothetical protein n=1 Tax=Bacillus sp. CGMCC 1.16607 TaxID=3351842 RepID=UPI00362D0F30
MKKRESNEQNNLFYEEEGTSQVTEQIMNAYNSGFVGEQDQDYNKVEGQTEL